MRYLGRQNEISYSKMKNPESMIKKCLAKNLNSKKKCKTMTQESQVENHKLAHKVLDTKNLLVFVVSERLFFDLLPRHFVFIRARTVHIIPLAGVN